jgi:hypothetical protein
VLCAFGSGVVLYITIIRSNYMELEITFVDGTVRVFKGNINYISLILKKYVDSIKSYNVLI